MGTNYVCSLTGKLIGPTPYFIEKSQFTQISQICQPLPQKTKTKTNKKTKKTPSEPPLQPHP